MRPLAGSCAPERAGRSRRAPAKWVLLRSLVASVTLAAPVSMAAPAREPLGLRAQLKCESATGPGKVQCMVRELPSSGDTITWGDVIVTSSPPFARPLRTRIGGDATKLDAEGAEVALALAATSEGRGELVVLARAVVCAPKGQGGGCRPLSVEATAEVIVGPSSGKALR